MNSIRKTELIKRASSCKRYYGKSCLWTRHLHDLIQPFETYIKDIAVSAEAALVELKGRQLLKDPDYLLPLSYPHIAQHQHLY